MALLDLQAMDSRRDGDDTRCISGLSVLLCDSIASITLCL
jgi:SapB morphogen precursor RamS